MSILPPVVLTRDLHVISRGNLSRYAIKVLYGLKDAGYQAHLVGGGVRDLMLGREPKDFDVATDASPEQVRAVFRNCRLIGRRFRLAHVHFGREIIEVATFRAAQPVEEVEQQHQTDEGMILRDNVYGTIEEDAIRRDFTINALYYNIADFSVIDYAGGVQDLDAGVIRLMGDPETRYREDPVRMIRAIRFAAKLGFIIDRETAAPISEIGNLMEDVPAARLFEEVLKLFMHGTAVASFEKLRQYGLFKQQFPDTEAALAEQDHDFPITLVRQGLENTDARVNRGQPVSPAFLFAVLLWEPVRMRSAELVDDGVPPYPAMQQAANEVLGRQLQRVLLPKRFSTPMREIWVLQGRFSQLKGKRPTRLASHPRFRAAYDFLLLRAESGETDQKLAQWWTEYQQENTVAPEPPMEHDRSKNKKRHRNNRHRRGPGSRKSKSE